MDQSDVFVDIEQILHTVPQRALCALIARGYSFALFKLPQRRPQLVIQKGPATELESLRTIPEDSGFLFAPFAPNSASPVLFIEHDYAATGAAAIAALLSDLALDGYTHHAFSPAAAGNTARSLARSALLDEVSSSLREEHHSFASRWGQLAGSPLDFARYAQSFASCMAALQSGSCRKVVLSRSQEITLPISFSLLEAWARAAIKSSVMMVSLVFTPQSGIWLGSTPELLLSSQQGIYKTVALAGTMVNPELSVTAHLPLSIWSEKNRHEQQLVTDYIKAVLEKYSERCDVTGPVTHNLGKVLHLKSDFTFILKTGVCLGDLLSELHPTPAVCGLPKERALEVIQDSEGYDRTYYAGVLGPVNMEKSSRLFVNLRCMHLEDAAAFAGESGEVEAHQATLYAGGGIIIGSEMKDEFNETCLKMEMLASMVARGAV